eukprot:7350034-Karenia_brevis.AAC.1
MLQINGIRGGGGHAPGALRVEKRPTPQGLQPIWHLQMVPLTEDDWRQGPQGLMSLAHAYVAAGLSMDMGHSPAGAIIVS